MPFIGFNFDKIEAFRNKDELKGNINVKHTLNIIDVKQQEVSVDKKQEVLKFIFEFKLDYEPEIGAINIIGNMMYIDDIKRMKEVLQEWKKTKKLPQELMQGLFNTILTKANIKALSLSQDINLPPHLPLPKLEPTQNKTNYNEYIG